MHVVVLLLLSHFFFWPVPVDWQMLQDNVAIRGIVVDEVSGRGIAGAVVYAVSGADVERTTSDSKGRFFFFTLLPGNYRLCASKPGEGPECRPEASRAEELFAGFEYGATVIL